MLPAIWIGCILLGAAVRAFVPAVAANEWLKWLVYCVTFAAALVLTRLYAKRHNPAEKDARKGLRRESSGAGEQWRPGNGRQ